MKKNAAEEQQRQLVVLLGIVGLVWLLGGGGK
jgi:hypothetical protein